VAQRRHDIDPKTIAKALEVLENGSHGCLIRTLHGLGALTDAQARGLVDLRRRGRPAGLKLVSVLGKGASATVYKARDDEGRSFAVKVSRDATPRDFRRREHEVRALDRLRHEAIPRLISVGAVDGRPFYVMDHVEGETLSSLSQRKGKLPWPLVVEVGLAIARALEHVHEAGMVHRDVKPSNVLVTAGGARLVDFGLACKPGAVSNGAAVGTPGYMSPEMARGEGASVASDTYSFGAMLYYALTGSYPFDAETAHEMIRLAADPARFVKPLLAHREDLPARLIALVEGCMEKDPAKRPAFADIVLTLERVRIPVAACARKIAAASSRSVPAVKPRKRRRRRYLAA
jgi:serine/threonine protein kinase